MFARFRRLITILAALALSMSLAAPVVAQSAGSFVIQIQPKATLLHDNTMVEVHTTYTCTFPEGGLSSAEEDYSGFSWSVTQGAVSGTQGAGAQHLTCDGTSRSPGFSIPSGSGLWTAGQATFTFFVQFTEAVSHDVFRLEVPNYSITLTPATPFTDIATSPFKSDIEWVYLEGITSGCSATLYCPNGFVTREQMASFLARALHLSGAAPDAFSDDEMSIHEANIKPRGEGRDRVGLCAQQVLSHGPRLPGTDGQLPGPGQAPHRGRPRCLHRR